MTDFRVSELWYYPIKSCGGICTDAALLEPYGLEHDRRFLLVDADNKFVTQRQIPLLSTIRVGIVGKNMSLGNQAGQELCFTFGASGKAELQAEIWGDKVNSFYVSHVADEFFSDTFGRPLRLVRMSEPNSRQHQKLGHGFATSFADSAPVLFAFSATLDALNQDLVEQIPMSRFRPNIIISGTTAWDEKGRNKIAVGGWEFPISYDCTRCLVVNIDQSTGEKSGKNPLLTLSKKFPGEPAVFGLRAVPAQEAAVAVGDSFHFL